MADLAASINAHLCAKDIPPTQQWLQHFIQSIRPTTPMPALQKTAEFRLLGTDIATSLRPTLSSTLPAGVSNPDVKELRIPGPVPVQVLDIEDVGRSRWGQVEAIEMEERGETRKGHEVIRIIPEEEDSHDHDTPSNPTSQQSGPHKLLVQDAKGNKVFAFELESVRGIGLDMSIGAKMVLKDFTVARGVILLTAKSTSVLGGKIDTWDKKWREDRKQVLKEMAGWRAENAGST